LKGFQKAFFRTGGLDDVIKSNGHGSVFALDIKNESEMPKLYVRMPIV
jgi:hypothetical protein